MKIICVLFIYTYTVYLLSAKWMMGLHTVILFFYSFFLSFIQIPILHIILKIAVHFMSGFLLCWCVYVIREPWATLCSLCFTFYYIHLQKVYLYNTFVYTSICTYCYWAYTRWYRQRNRWPSFMCLFCCQNIPLDFQVKYVPISQIYMYRYQSLEWRLIVLRMAGLAAFDMKQ